jgi:N-acetylneuraminic acid mutarotase
MTLKDFWEYNPVTNSWTQKADYPGNGGAGVYYATAFVLDFKGYVVGGKVGSQLLTDEVWEYKPFNNTWVQRSNFPGGNRYQMTSFAVAGKAYVGLGADQNTYRDEIWEFNAGNGVWTQKTDFAGGDRGQVVSFTIGERGFVCTGKDGGLKSDLWEYNPYSDAWTARASYGGSARCGAAGFVCYGKAYVGTGDGYSGKKESMWEYTPMLVLGINDASQMNLNLYPNPVTEQLTITGCGQAEFIQIFDINGRTVYVDRINNQNEIQINCSSFAKGEYTVQITGKNNSVFTDKIEVQ